MTQPTYVLGGAQTDFARNWIGEGKGIYDLFAEVVPDALADARVGAAQVDVVHVGNLAAELFTGQAQLGGMVVAVDPAFDGVPSTRHEAACASGGTALLAAGADLESGRYDVALVVGVEVMRNVPAQQAAANLGSAAWVGREAQDAEYVWPAMFAEIADVYDARYGLDHEPLGRFAEIAFANARRNPYAQAREWSFGPGSFAEDDTANPLVEGRLRKTDCGRISDGAAAVVLAGPRFAEEWARERGIDLAEVPVIAGWGHRTSTLLLADKLARSESDGYLFPQLRGAVTDAYRRARVPGPQGFDVAEIHDCFTINGQVTIEHIGLAEPGKGGQAVLDGVTELTGELPVNPSGGLMAAGHPVGATGVRMVLDAARQVTGRAGEAQVEGARTALTVNIGGSFTTAVSTVIRRGA